MADLFSNDEALKVEPQKNKIFYKGKDGKFTDKESARIADIEKQNKVLNANFQYWKRQAERLHLEYNQEHKKVLRMELEMKQLQKTPINEKQL